MGHGIRSSQVSGGKRYEIILRLASSAPLRTAVHATIFFVLFETHASGRGAPLFCFDEVPHLIVV